MRKHIINTLIKYMWCIHALLTTGAFAMVAGLHSCAKFSSDVIWSPASANFSTCAMLHYITTALHKFVSYTQHMEHLSVSVARYQQQSWGKVFVRKCSTVHAHVVCSVSCWWTVGCDIALQAPPINRNPGSIDVLAVEMIRSFRPIWLRRAFEAKSVKSYCETKAFR